MHTWIHMKILMKAQPKITIHGLLNFVFIYLFLKYCPDVKYLSHTCTFMLVYTVKLLILACFLRLADFVELKKNAKLNSRQYVNKYHI